MSITFTTNKEFCPKFEWDQKISPEQYLLWGKIWRNLVTIWQVPKGMTRSRKIGGGWKGQERDKNDLA